MNVLCRRHKDILNKCDTTGISAIETPTPL